MTAFDAAAIAQPPAPSTATHRFTSAEAARYPVLAECDLLVVGGGSAGSAAAVAAARAGADVLVLERAGFLGGTAVAVLDTMYGFFPPGSDDRVVGGPGWEVADSLLTDDQAILRANTYGAGTGVTYEPEALKRAWDVVLVTAGVRLLLHATMFAVVRDEAVVRGIIVTTPRGPYAVAARRVVDATGDAQVAWASGCALEMPAAQLRVQPLTATFRMGGVGDVPPTAELHRLMRDAAASGEYRLPRLEGSAHRTVLPGVYHTNLTRVSGVDATNPWAITAAEVEGRAQVAEYVRFLRDRVPGYERAHLLGSSVWIGTRETRRLVGRHVLTRDEVVEARRHPDEIALCGAPIEDHDGGDATIWRYVGSDDDRPTGQVYGIPYGCLLPVEVDGLLVAGRGLSATHDAHASARSIAQCTALGHAAGVAAALSLERGVSPAGLDPTLIRDKLRTDGAIL